MDARLGRVPIRFQIGEKSLWIWRPALAAVEAAGLDEASKNLPGTRELPDGAEGWLWRRLPKDRFPLGVSRAGPWLVYVRRVEKLFYVDLEGSFDQYLERFSAKRRHNLKRSVRWFHERSGGAPLTTAIAPEEMEEFQRRAVEISRQTYQDRLIGAGMPATAEFLQAMRDAAAKGLARGFLLWCEGRPAAFAWCSGQGDRLTYSVIGYLPEYAKWSPGTTLLYLILEQLFHEQRFRKFDFGVGEGWYKESFSTGYDEFLDALLFRNTWRNRALVWTHWSLERLNSAAGALLERWGLKKAVKKWMRTLAGAR